MAEADTKSNVSNQNNQSNLEKNFTTTQTQIQETFEECNVNEGVSEVHIRSSNRLAIKNRIKTFIVDVIEPLSRQHEAVQAEIEQDEVVNNYSILEKIKHELEQTLASMWDKYTVLNTEIGSHKETSIQVDRVSHDNRTLQELVISLQNKIVQPKHGNQITQATKLATTPDMQSKSQNALDLAQDLSMNELPPMSVASASMSSSSRRSASTTASARLRLQAAEVKASEEAKRAELEALSARQQKAEEIAAIKRQELEQEITRQRQELDREMTRQQMEMEKMKLEGELEAERRRREVLEAAAQEEEQGLMRPSRTPSVVQVQVQIGQLNQ